ncbi:MAG: hypothetical protein KatS3mg085_175 [Candidatus Dojkabacteria bacterium]|nr:MAG: hypothetical protein KatS3mg085_175 [Candidatus Dojkabacteria bacterium]
MSDIIEKQQDGVREISRPFEETEKAQEPQKVVEKIVYVEKKGGFFTNLRKKITYFVIIPLIFFCFLLFYISLTQTDPFWGVIVKFLNQGPTYEKVETNLNFEDVKNNVETQIGGFGENVITLNNTEMTVLARKFLQDSPNLTVSANDGVLRIYKELTSQPNREQLLARVDIKTDSENNPYISYIGFNRIGLPENISKELFNFLLPLFKFSLKTESPKEMLTFILTGNQNNIIDEITFEEGYANITLNVTLNIFAQ